MKKNKIDLDNFTAVNSTVKATKIEDDPVLNVIKNIDILEVDEPTYARVNNIEFQNGVIEVKVYSQLLSDAPDFARGFIGVTFRINEDNTAFEGLYIRPTNGRTDNPARKNRAVQCFSYPNHKFDQLRETEPDVYEAAADIGLDEWIDLRIVVKDATAYFYINQSVDPVLTVKNLKYGISKGGVALWSDIGTDAYFKDLSIDLIC